MEGDGDPAALAACSPRDISREEPRCPHIPEHCVPPRALSPAGRCHPTPLHRQCPRPPPSVPGLPGSPSLLPDVGAVGVTPDKRYRKRLVSGGLREPWVGAREGLSRSLPRPAASPPAPGLPRSPRTGDPSPQPPRPRGPQQPPTLPSCTPLQWGWRAGAARGAGDSVGGRRCWHYCYGRREQRDPPHAQITVSKSVAFSLGGSGASSLASASGVRYSRWWWPQIGVVRSCQRCGDTVSAPRDGSTRDCLDPAWCIPPVHREQREIWVGIEVRLGQGRD